MTTDAPLPVDKRHAPLLGEHTVELLRELDYSPDEIADLFAVKSAVDGQAREPGSIDS